MIRERGGGSGGNLRVTSIRRWRLAVAVGVVLCCWHALQPRMTRAGFLEGEEPSSRRFYKTSERPFDGYLIRQPRAAHQQQGVSANGVHPSISALLSNDTLELLDSLGLLGSTRTSIQSSATTNRGSSSEYLWPVGSQGWLHLRNEAFEAAKRTRTTMLAPQLTQEETIKTLRAAGLEVEPNYLLFRMNTRPNDDQYSAISTTMQQIQAPDAWSIFTGSNQVKVCVIDTGIQGSHPDLADNVGEVYDAILNRTPARDNDADGHGTHCAGTIGAVGNNGRGIAGVAWRVNILGCKFLGPQGGSTADAIDCIRWCREQGAKITSNSWGSDGAPPAALVSEIRKSQEAGHLFICAAGNDNVDVDSRPTTPAGANLPAVITVGAVDGSDRRANFSNYGRRLVHLFAPGVSIFSTVPTSSYARYSGTSMACPHVAGAAALLWGYRPGASAVQIKDALLRGVDFVAGGQLSLSGGRLNLLNSLRILGGNGSPSPPPSPQPPPDESSEFAIRLVGGSSKMEGRVEIFYNNAWGTVCDDYFDVEEARVICSQLGYAGGTAFTQAQFGQGTGPIWLDNLFCDPSLHIRLHECPHNGWGAHNCEHDEDAGVRCIVCADKQTSCASWALQGYCAPQYVFNGESVAYLVCPKACRTCTDVPPSNPSPSPPSPRSPPPLAPEFTVRLVGGASQLEGRVEIFYRGSWGTVCDDEFDVEEARVICRQLGFRGGEAFGQATFGQGAGPIWLDTLRCNSQTHTRLHDCPNDGWGRHDCGHSEDAGVQCSSVPSMPSPSPPRPQPPPPRPRQFDVRLMGGASQQEGRVEIYYNGAWGTVCDDGFGNEEAQVICRQLGYTTGIAFSRAGFGQGTGPIWLDELSCAPRVHNRLHLCPSKGWGVHDCGHKEDAGVLCQSSVPPPRPPPPRIPQQFAIRLLGGASELEGRVEIFYNSTWGTVCDDGFDDEEARVICRQLGYSDGVGVSQASFGQGTGPIWLDMLSCNVNTHTRLQDCPHNGWGVHDCGHKEDAGVVCLISGAAAGSSQAIQPSPPAPSPPTPLQVPLPSNVHRGSKGSLKKSAEEENPTAGEVDMVDIASLIDFPATRAPPAAHIGENSNDINTNDQAVPQRSHSTPDNLGETENQGTIAQPEESGSKTAMLPSGGGGLPLGTVAGIIVGCVVGVAMLMGTVVGLTRWRMANLNLGRVVPQ